MAKPGDHFGDLKSRKLTTLTRLGTLGHLDFDFPTGIEVFCRDTKASRRHLLDGRCRIGAILTGHKIGRILTAFTGIRFGANAVHGNIQGFMGLGR